MSSSESYHHAGHHDHDNDNDNEPISLKRPRDQQVVVDSMDHDDDEEGDDSLSGLDRQQQRQPQAKRTKRVHDRVESWSSFSSTASIPQHLNQGGTSHNYYHNSTLAQATQPGDEMASTIHTQTGSGFGKYYQQQHQNHHQAEWKQQQTQPQQHQQQWLVGFGGYKNNWASAAAGDGSVVSVSSMSATATAPTTVSPTMAAECSADSVMDYKPMNSLLGHLHLARQRKQLSENKTGALGVNAGARPGIEKGPSQESIPSKHGSDSHHHHHYQHQQQSESSNTSKKKVVSLRIDSNLF